VRSIKIVQSFWSCNHGNLLKFNAGWYAPEYNLMGWALSCLQLKKYYNNVVLYADSVAAKMLVDTLQLPYTEVISNLDKLNITHPQLWALPKICAYSQQDSPFLHVDGDVFIWKPFDDKLLKSGLIAQNVEAATSYYENIMQELEASLSYFPAEIIEERKKRNLIYAYNAGIFGGSDIAFINSYTQKAKQFIDNNISCFSKINVGNFNIFFEQYLFYAMVKKHKKSVGVLIDAIIGDNEYIGFGDFMEVPHNKQYLHLLGVYKRNKMVCEQMANRLRQDYPEYYYRIIALFKNKQIPLKKDYYYFISQPAAHSLKERYSSLKKNYKNIEQKNTKHNYTIKSKAVARFRAVLVKDKISALQNEKQPQQSSIDFTEHLNDIALFENKLARIIKDKFIS
jgi:hypothetical protein